MDMFEFARWGKDLDYEFSGASDRGVAVVGAAMLDAHLRIVLDTYLANVPNKAELFEDSYAPLSSLSGKTDLALGLGLISTREHRNLTLIRRIRNQFAHRIGDLSFGSPEISSRCRELEVPDLMRMPEEFSVEFLTHPDKSPAELEPVAFSTPRERFQVAVKYMSNCLMGRLIEVMEIRCAPRPEYQRLSQIMELSLAEISRIKGELEVLQSLVDELKSRSKADEVYRIEAQLEELKQDPSYQMTQTLSAFMSEMVLDFVQRWENSIEASQES